MWLSTPVSDYTIDHARIDHTGKGLNIGWLTDQLIWNKFVNLGQGRLVTTVICPREENYANSTHVLILHGDLGTGIFSSSNPAYSQLMLRRNDSQYS